MDMASFITFAQIIGPAVAAWVSVKVGISQALAAASAAMEKAAVAHASADKAHTRIDSILSRGGA